MLDALPPDARAAAAAAALVALPGVLVVRSPWRAMPLVSLAFWVVSWTWPLGGSRTRVLQVALAMFAALALLRVVRPGPLPRWRRPQMLIVLTAIVLAAPGALRVVPSGSRAPIQALAAELLAWHDGWPSSFEPLSPRQPFQTGGLATLAADVVLLSGAPPHRALFAATAAADVALLLAFWSLAAVRVSPGRAAAIAAAVLLPVAAVAQASGVLACAFAAEAVALWYDRRGHPSAFTAGACLAAAIATDATTALGGLLLVLLFSRPRDGVADAAPAPPASARLRTMAWTAAVLALPLAWRVPAMAAPDPAALAGAAVVGLLGSVARRPSVSAWRVWAGSLGAVAASGVFLGLAAGDAVTRDEVAAMAWIHDHAGPLDLVCAADVPAARWIPALAARATTAPLGPGWPRPNGPCAVGLSLAGLSPPGVSVQEAPAFRAGGAAVWTTSQKR